VRFISQNVSNVERLFKRKFCFLLMRANFSFKSLSPASCEVFLDQYRLKLIRMPRVHIYSQFLSSPFLNMMEIRCVPRRMKQSDGQIDG
jgi:hypothetical protein